MPEGRCELDGLMSKQEDNNYGRSDNYDLELVEKVLHLIERHHQEKHITPNITSLRNTMLAISALLHLECIKTQGLPGETFEEAAKDQLNIVTDAASTIRQRKN